MNYKKDLLIKIKKREAVVGIIGIGYVGDALALGASTAGFQVIGFTRSESRLLNVKKRRIRNYLASTDVSLLKKCNLICICVPTPVNKDKSPDLTAVKESLQNTAKYLQKGTLVILESTIAPGTTRNIALPILKKSGYMAETEFFLAFSPERVDPGNKKYQIGNTPRVVSGLSNASKILASNFYRTFITKVITTTSLEAAEMSKILENTFRLVNISLMNELLSYTNSLGIDLWEVIRASATKPFGFLPHYPGPGIGGHCIPVDPYYLLADAKKRGVTLGITEQAGLVNEQQPKRIAKKTLDILKKTNGEKKEHSALLIGITYKKDIGDKRESPSLKVWECLRKRGIDISYHDPYAPRHNNLSSVSLAENNISDKDIIIILTPHSNVNYEQLVAYNKPILDTRNILKNYSAPNIYRI